MADGWFDELLRSLFAPAPVQVLQVPTLPKKQEGTQAPARTDAKLVLDHPLTVADLGEGAPSAKQKSRVPLYYSGARPFC